ncbi:MAG: histidine kinase [Gemmatimonadaceae bacterium]
MNRPPRSIADSADDATRITVNTLTTSVPASRRKLPILGIFAVWTVWGLWSAQQSALVSMVTGQSTAARANPLSLAMLTALFWALLTPVLMVITRRIHDTFPTIAQRVAAHIAVLIPLHFLDITSYWFMTDWIAHNPRPYLPMLWGLVTLNAMTYTVIAVIITAIDSHDSLRARQTRENQLETQLALAQFHALRAQLHPHFLFNALNAVSSLIHTDPQRADRMLARVSELLRIAIDTAAQPEIPLRDEIEFARRYLEVERMRYGDRLDVRIDVAGDTGSAMVPNMLLQPLVENAVRHGVAPHAKPGCVDVHVERHGEQLTIVVRDTGTGFDTDEASLHSDERANGSGVGLSTTRARLEKLYGANQRLDFVSVTGGFEARVTLPFQRAAVA